MTAFWVICGIFIIVALLFVVPTLLRQRNVGLANLEHDAVNISVYRDQLAELDKDLENDILSQEQYDKSKHELQQRMLQDVAGQEKVLLQQNKKLQNIALATVITLGLPLAAVFLYLNIGDTRGLLPQAQLASATQMNRGGGGGMEDLSGHDFSAALENLVARLSNNPEDVEGWLMLAKTYTAMERFTEASNTYAKLTELIPDNSQILSDYARVLGLKNGGTLVGKPTELLHQALKIDPEYPPALALTGHAEFEQENYAAASGHWEKLLATIPADSPLAKSVRDSIAEAKLLGSGKQTQAVEQTASNTQAASNVAESDKSVEAEQSDEKQEIKAGAVASANALTISGQVSIRPELASKASANDTLFIYARAKTGPKMPLAILRLSARDLPASFTLTDDMAMMPTMKMSSFPEVVIEARISKSGQAVPASGDLQGFSEPVKLGNNNLSIVIDRQIP